VIDTLADVMFGARNTRAHSFGTMDRSYCRGVGSGWRVGTRTLHIEPRSRWENGYCESFNGKLRDEFLNSEIFYSLKEALLTERWRVEYNTERPHSALGCRPPAPQAILSKQPGMEIWKTLHVSHIPSPP